MQNFNNVLLKVWTWSYLTWNSPLTHPFLSNAISFSLGINILSRRGKRRRQARIGERWKNRRTGNSNNTVSSNQSTHLYWGFCGAILKGDAMPDNMLIPFEVYNKMATVKRNEQKYPIGTNISKPYHINDPIYDRVASYNTYKNRYSVKYKDRY